MSRTRTAIRAITGKALWATILVPILAISWLGFYTVARAVGVPPLFAAGMSAAFDGVVLFAARIGLKHRRKGYSGYLARITVIVFVALGAFVQSFHGEATSWIHAHSWVVWASAPIAAAVAYELHLGWVNRKRLIEMGYAHPSAKSGFGPATWFLFPKSTLDLYREGLQKRREFIARSNVDRFTMEEAVQPSLSSAHPVSLPTSPPAPVQEAAPVKVRVQRPKPVTRPVARPVLTPVPNPRPAQKPKTNNTIIQEWCKENGFELGYRGRVSAAGLRAYRDAHRAA